jgi:hypothetical protein
MLSVSNDRGLVWYRLAHRSLIALAGLILLAFPGMPVTSADLSQDARLAYVALEGVFACLIAVFALRVRESSMEIPDRGNLTRLVRLRPANFKGGRSLGELAEQLGGPEELDRREARSVTSGEFISRNHESLAARRARMLEKNVSGSDASELARRLDSDRIRLQRIEDEQAPPRAVGEEKRALTTPASLSPEGVQVLFEALRKGTAKHFDREPSVAELVRLVRTAETTLGADLILSATRSANLEFHWQGDKLAFEPGASSAAPKASEPVLS